MGYRSQVLIIIQGSKVDVDTQLAALRLTSPDPKILEWIKEFDRITEEDQLTLRYYGSDVKWYPDYDDVQGIESIYCHFSDLENVEGSPPIDGKFIRVGENEDDIEHRGFGNEPYELADVSVDIHSQYLHKESDAQAEANDLKSKSDLTQGA